MIIDALRRYFVSGVLVVVPIILTYVVLSFMFESIDGILPLIAQYQNLAAAAKAENFAPDLRSKLDAIEEEIDLEFLIE